MMRISWVTAMLITLLSGCAAPGNKVAIENVDLEEYLRYAERGPYRITGKCLADGIGDYSEPCRNMTISLQGYPHWVEDLLEITRNGDQWVAADGRRIEADFRKSVSEAIKRVWRKASTDTQGNFTFEGLPAGRWYVWYDTRSNRNYGGKIYTVMGEPVKMIFELPGTSSIVLEPGN